MMELSRRLKVFRGHEAKPLAKRLRVPDCT